MSLVKQKKGDVFQVILMIILVFVVAVVGLICLVLSVRINNFWEQSGLINDSSTAQQSISTLQKTGPKSTDYAVFFLFIGFIIGATIAAVRTDFNAITVILFIFLMAVSIFVAAGYVNLYRGLADNAGITDVSSKLTLTNFLFSKYLPLMVAVLCAFIMILMYGKSSGEIVR